MITDEPKTFMCDIDGTLANIAHRRQYVATKPKNWKLFDAGMKDDLPIPQTIWMVQQLYSLGHTILLTSGRGDDHRDVTVQWLWDHSVPYHALYMRKAKDYRPDDIIKEEILAKIREDGYDPFFVIDDRARVNRMWIRNGIYVFDVAQGQGEF